MKKGIKISQKILIFLTLTILTQVGGIIYLLCIWIGHQIKWKSSLKLSLTFLSLYLTSTFIIIPHLAILFGRELVISSEKIGPTTHLTTLLNRNYVRPEMNLLLKNLADRLRETKIQINYLDANFPFIDHFPLFPHLSHNDGKKLDLSLIYETTEGEISHEQQSNSGYGVFVNPEPFEHNQIQRCLEAGYFQYDYPQYLTFGTKNPELTFSEKGTKRLIKEILKDASLEKLFIEPHLKSRLQLNNNKIRYHGCQAVRHDDHLHIQIK